MLTLFGALAVTFMMLTYAPERRDPRFILAFACGCLLPAPTGFSRAPGRSVWWKSSGRWSPFIAIA
jgi:hypothetical protein